MSHILLWKKCVDENLSFIGIFEDDIILSESARQLLTQTDWIKACFERNDTFIIKLETVRQKCRYKPTSIHPTAKHQLVQLRSRHFGSAGYIVTQSMAKSLLHKLKTLPPSQIHQADVMLFSNQNLIVDSYIYQLIPAICVQMVILDESTVDFASQINRTTQIKKQYSLLGKLIREIKKIPWGIRRFFSKEIPFSKT